MRECGMTLVELMFSMTLCLIVTAFIFTCYLHSNGCMTFQADIYQLQEVAVSVSDLLASEIQQSGYIGCKRLMPGFIVSGEGGRELTVANQLITSFGSIVSRHAAMHAATVSSHSRSALIVSDNVIFKKGDILLISDCQHAEIFSVKQAYHRASQQTIESSSALHHDYSVGAEVAHFEENKFFVRKTKRKHPNGQTIYALFMENINHDIRQLIDDIDQANFQIHYRGAVPVGADYAFKLHVNTLEREWFAYVQIAH